MKKIVAFGVVAMILLNGCTLGSSKHSALLKQDGQYDIEPNARITVQMEDEAYAQALLTLWNKTYPMYKDALQIKIDPYQRNDDISSDVLWINEQDMLHIKDDLYDIDGLSQHIFYHVAKHLNRDAQYYLPMEGIGMIFMYNEQTLRERGGDSKDMTSFEHMKNLTGDVYYHNRMNDYVYPFLFTLHEEEGIAWLQEDTFYENLVRYRRLNEEVSLIDDQLERNQFYEGSYVCGLVMNDGSYREKEVYKKGKLHATTMPTYQGVTFSPVVDTYGFVLHKDTKYPAACMAFLQLVRSEKGIQVLLDTTLKTPLIEEAEQLVLFDNTRKEIIEAMNGSQLRDISMNAYLQQSSFYSQIENSLYTKESNKQIWKKINKE